MFGGGQTAQTVLGGDLPGAMPHCYEDLLRWIDESSKARYCARKLFRLGQPPEKGVRNPTNSCIREQGALEGVAQPLPQGASSNHLQPGVGVGGPSKHTGLPPGLDSPGDKPGPGTAHLGDHNRLAAWAAYDQTREVGLRFMHVPHMRPRFSR